VIRSILATLIITAIAIAVTAAILGGVHVDGGMGTYLWLAVVFGLVNAILGPILRIISLPLTILTLGLFALVVNGVLIAITAWLSSDIAVDSFGWAILAGLIMSIVVAVLRAILGTDDRDARYV
jgi:putative membrane protein